MLCILDTLYLSMILPCVVFMHFTMGDVPPGGTGQDGMSPMITSKKSTHGSVPFKPSVVRGILVYHMAAL